MPAHFTQGHALIIGVGADLPVRGDVTRPRTALEAVGREPRLVRLGDPE